MNTILLYRLGGFVLLLAGITLWIDAALEIIYPNMAFGLCFLVSILGLLGLTAVFFYQGDRAKSLGLVAYFFSFIGLAGILGVAINNNIFSIVIDPAKMDALLNSSSNLFFIASGCLFIFGSVLMGISVWIADRFPKITSVLYLGGSIPLALPTVIGKPYVELGAVAVGLSVVIWGMTLIFNKDEVAGEVFV